MNKVYKRTENGTTTHVSIREGLDEINHAMMAGKKDVREMFAGSTGARITYKDGRRVMLLKVDAPKEEPAEPNIQTHTGAVHAPGSYFKQVGGKAPKCCASASAVVGRYHYLLPTNAPVTCKRCLNLLAKEAGK